MAAAIEANIAAPAELEALFLAHHARTLKAAYRITGSMADAEDVAQTVFLRLLQQDAYRQAIENPESYIYRAAINAALDLLRKRRREQAVAAEQADPVAHGGAERDCQAAELREWLRRALADLSPTAAEMFVLRYVEGYDNGQVARIMNTSRAVVAVMLYRARARLRNQFRSYMRRPPQRAKNGLGGDAGGTR